MLSTLLEGQRAELLDLVIAPFDTFIRGLKGCLFGKGNLVMDARLGQALHVGIVSVPCDISRGNHTLIGG